MYHKESDIKWYIDYYASLGKIITQDDAIAMIEHHEEINRLHSDLDCDDNCDIDCDYDYDYIDCVDIE